MLTDDSAGEQSAIKKAFGGLLTGEMEVDHLLCKVHSRRTIDRKLKGPQYQQIRNHLYAALYNRKTRPGCEESMQAAIQAASTDAMRKYLKKEWETTMNQWANYARCHSALLLQVSSTNIVESWHSALKRDVKLAMTKWSLLGCVRHVANISYQWSRKAAKAEAEFRTKHLSDTIFWEGMKQLPYPVQQLCIEQSNKGSQLLERGAKVRELNEDVSCDCVFYRAYHLPCEHMWYQEHLVGSVLTDALWERCAFMFADCGFEIYEGMETTYSHREIYEEIGAPSKRRLQVSLMFIRE